MKTHTLSAAAAAVLLLAVTACAGASAPAKSGTQPGIPGLPSDPNEGGRRGALSYQVPCYTAQGGASIVAASGCTITIESGGTLDATAGTVLGATANDLNGGLLTIDADADTTLIASTDDVISTTLGAATGYLNVLTGNLKVGNGTPGLTLSGEDLYVEGTLENDGGANLAGGQTLAGTLVTTAASPVAATTGALVSLGFLQPLTAAGTVTPTITPGAAGTTTCFYMTSAQTAVFVDSGNVVLAGNFSMGQYDQLCGVSDGTRWIERSRSNN